MTEMSPEFRDALKAIAARGLDRLRIQHETDVRGAVMASRKDTDPDLTPHQQWRQDSINNATNPDTGEKVPTDVRAGDLADSTADQNTNTSSSSKK